jgi:hypothetical protein
MVVAASAEERQPGEYEVKAAFLMHFARLTDWPIASIPAGQPFVIAVIGQDPFGEALDDLAAGQTAHDRRIEIRRYATVDAVQDQPQIAFVNAAGSEVRRALAHFGGAAVLTVGDRDGFLENGGMVRFRLTAERNVRFDIDQGVVTARGLKISSQVLKLARLVNGTGP